MEQVAAMTQPVDSGHHSPSMEGRLSVALLNSSATVQVKEVQLHQVTQYHQQIQALKDTLQGLETELDTLNL